MAEKNPTITLDGNISPLKQKLREAGDDLRRFGATGGPAVDGVAASVMKLTTRFTALGAVLSLGGLAAMARQSIDAADRLNDLALRTQTSVKALASFKLIAEQSGTDLAALGKGINKLSIWMAENAEAAKKLGITARDPVEAFIQFAAALERAETPQQRAKIANKVMGKSFQELLPLLMEGADNLRAAAAASEDYANKLEKLAPQADKFNDDLAALKQNVSGLAAQLAGPLVEALNRVIERFGKLNRMGSASLFEKLTGKVSGNLPSSIKYVNEQIAKQEEIIARQSKNPRIGFSTAVSQKELDRLKQLKAELREISMGEAMKIAEAQYKGGAPGGGGKLTIEDFDPPKNPPKTPKAKAAKEFDLDAMRLEDAQASARMAEKETEQLKRAAQQALQIKLLQIDGVRDAEMARIAELEAQSAQEVALNTATQQEHLTNLAAFNQQRLAADQTYLAQKKELALQDPEQNPVELERIELEKAEIRRRYAAQGMDIQRQQTLESQTLWQSLTDSISGLWDRGVQALMNGTLTWRNAFKAIGAELVGWFATNVVGKKVKEWIAGETAQTLATKLGAAARSLWEKIAGIKTIAAKSAETTSVAGMNAVQAGTGAAASQASIPIVGPLLALAAMAAIFAAVSSMGKKRSAAGGYDIPRGLNPMTQLHEEEMVLPKHLANAVRGMTGEGAGGSNPISVTMNIQTPDADSFRASQDQISADMHARIAALSRGV